MRVKLSAVCIAASMSVCLPPVMAQQADSKTLYSYSVPFTCGPSNESKQEGVVTGIHATAITIHNPSLQAKATFSKSVTRALPFQRPGAMSAAEQQVLEANQAVEVECNEIRMKLPASMTTQFRAGVLSIRSTHLLSVSAVYSSRPGAGEVSTIDVEIIQPQQLSPRHPAYRDGASTPH